MNAKEQWVKEYVEKSRRVAKAKATKKKELKKKVGTYRPKLSGVVVKRSPRVRRGLGPKPIRL
jgi:hypothetical protein